MRVWHYDPATDARPQSAQPGDRDDRRAVLLAAPEDNAEAVAWMAVDDYEDGEATLLFGAPPGDEYREYVNALLARSIEEARRHGFASVLAHWRAGWSSATSALTAQGFAEAAPGVWRRTL